MSQNSAVATRPQPADLSAQGAPAFKVYMCLTCGFVYDEAAGLPEEGIAPGTRWEDIPESWRCPDCGVGKEDFDMVEV
jgi:rubredoxin-NAD+ reductase